MAGTHRGTFIGVPATGRGVLVRRIDVFSVVGGKIVDVLHNFDLVGLMPQIGAFPSLAFQTFEA
jgi:predicted ester cyclase